MPIREYQVKEEGRGCPQCRLPFERIEHPRAQPLTHCPACGAGLIRLISAPRVGASRSGSDARAKQAGFHKLKKISKGEYEKIY